MRASIESKGGRRNALDNLYCLVLLLLGVVSGHAIGGLSFYFADRGSNIIQI